MVLLAMKVLVVIPSRICKSIGAICFKKCDNVFCMYVNSTLCLDKSICCIICVYIACCCFSCMYKSVCEILLSSAL